VTLSTGAHDLYIQQDKFPAQFAADVPLPQAQLMASTQRPVTDAALNEPETTPAWTHIPSSHIYGILVVDLDVFGQTEPLMKTS
jgi:hypothetical protein